MKKHKFKSVPPFDKLFDNLEIDQILKETNGYRNYKDINKKRYTVKIVYRIKALLCYGKIDEAEELCYEAIDSNALLEKGQYMVNVFLYQIYYYKKELWKSFYYFNKIPTDDVQYINLIQKGFLFSLIEAGNKELYDEIVKAPDDWIIAHVLRKRAGESNFKTKTILNAIIQEFDKAEVYYDNTMQIRIFRCFNVGKSSYNGKLKTCDYIYVCSINEDPHSIKTFYLIDSPGSLKYHDITEVINKGAEKQLPTITNNESKSFATSKFLARQRKMKSKNN